LGALTTSASAFQHPTSKSGTEAFRYRGLVPAWAFFFITVPDSPDARQSGAFRIYKNWTKEKMGAPCSIHCHQWRAIQYTRQVHIADGTEGYNLHDNARPHYWRCRWIHPASPYYRKWKAVHPTCEKTPWTVLLSVDRNTPARPYTAATGVQPAFPTSHSGLSLSFLCVTLAKFTLTTARKGRKGEGEGVLF
jgi:hypothetical protein